MYSSSILVIFLQFLAIQAFKSIGFSERSLISVQKHRHSKEISMNMMDRFLRVVKSNVNNIIQNLEDPEKVLDQAVNDMQSDLIKIRQSYAEVSATQKRMEKQKQQAQSLASDWYQRAQLALQKGDEELAREALSRRQIQVEISENVNVQLINQLSAIEKLYSSMTALEGKITSAKRDKDLMIARARTAKTSVQVNDMLSSIGDSSSTAAFDRMKAKVESLEAQAEVSGELAASSSGSTLKLEDRFKALEGTSAVDAELEMMKKLLPSPSSSSSETARLPKSVNRTESMTQMDIEYEKLKKELGLQ